MADLRSREGLAVIVDALTRQITTDAELVDRVVDLTLERDSYRTLAQQLLHALHHVTLERDILKGQINIDRRRQHEPARKVAA